MALLATTGPYQLSHAVAKAVATRVGITVHHPDEAWSVPLVEFVCELGHPPLGPVAAAVQLLQREGRPEDVVVAAYADLPLKFSTELHVYGGETGALPPEGTEPRWLWPRPRWSYGAVAPTRRYIEERIFSGAYEPVPLGVRERLFENREDPHFHIFCEPPGSGAEAKLYRRRE